MCTFWTSCCPLAAEAAGASGRGCATAAGRRSAGSRNRSAGDAESSFRLPARTAAVAVACDLWRAFARLSPTKGRSSTPSTVSNTRAGAGWPDRSPSSWPSDWWSKGLLRVAWSPCRCIPTVSTSADSTRLSYSPGSCGGGLPSSSPRENWYVRVRLRRRSATTACAALRT